MKRLQIVIYIGLFFSFHSCDRAEYFPDKPIIYSKTAFLAHRGGGNFDEGNTLEGCKYGLEMLDGIECDIQKSSDNTLWLNHSPLIPACGTQQESCFSSISDKTIIQIDSCLGSEINYTKLEDIFEFMSKDYPNKYISIDVKAWMPCQLSNVNLTKEMNEMAQELIDLTIKYKLHNKVLVESETGDFLYYIKTNTKFIETYISTNGDFELGISRALHAGFSGISFKYKYLDNITKEDVEMLHRKGLKIQLWTVNDTTDIKEAISLKSDFVQTESVSFITKE